MEERRDSSSVVAGREDRWEMDGEEPWRVGWESWDWSWAFWRCRARSSFFCT